MWKFYVLQYGVHILFIELRLNKTTLHVSSSRHRKCKFYYEFFLIWLTRFVCIFVIKDNLNKLFSGQINRGITLHFFFTLSFRYSE
jgi:hypothetical protein